MDLVQKDWRCGLCYPVPISIIGSIPNLGYCRPPDFNLCGLDPKSTFVAARHTVSLHSVWTKVHKVHIFLVVSPLKKNIFLPAKSIIFLVGRRRQGRFWPRHGDGPAKAGAVPCQQSLGICGAGWKSRVKLKDWCLYPRNMGDWPNQNWDFLLDFSLVYIYGITHWRSPSFFNMVIAPPASSLLLVS